jgi:hypothetical protein
MEDGLEALSLALFKLRKVNISRHHYINDKLILYLFKNSKNLEDAVMFKCLLLTSTGIASVLIERPTLRSLSLSPISNLEVFKFQEFAAPNFIDMLVSLKGLTCLDLSRWCI